MKRVIPFLTLIVLLAASLSQAQLKSRVDLLNDQYQQDRARGLTLLNEKYIAQLEQELATASQSRNFEDVKAITARIEALKAEIAQLATANNAKASPPTEPEENEDPLIGKSAYFTHSNGKDEVWVEFEKDNEAVWVGLGQIAIKGWKWERDAPDLIYFWDP
ncbi:MAG: hypothetical protein KDN19_12515, partial [Verrucomicrobiae bacterium]|nr:hypothetical protein [Verrucomicrobiae bacterium]